MIDYVNAAIREHREPQDQVGVIVFGREPAIEIPPFDDNVQVPKQIESQLDPDYTNIAAAIKLAEAAFPHDAAKRMVLVSDGNQNLGDALEEGARRGRGGHRHRRVAGALWFAQRNYRRKNCPAPRRAQGAALRPAHRRQ